MVSNTETTSSDYALGYFNLPHYTDWCLCLWHRQPNSCASNYRETLFSISMGNYEGSECCAEFFSKTSVGILTKLVEHRFKFF